MKKLLEIPEKYYKTKSEEMIKVKQDESYLRDHFAGLAMQAEISRWDGERGSIDYENTARRAYKMADAMLKSRKENNNG